MKSAEFYSANANWEKAYIEINPQNLHLRKILQLNDVTICLDRIEDKKKNKINFYQDPLIYRCSFQSRFDLVHQNNNASNPNIFNPQLSLVKLNFYCRKFDVSITDQQLPMVIRLIELIIAIIDGTLKLPESQSNESSFLSSLNGLNPVPMNPESNSPPPITRGNNNQQAAPVELSSTELLSEQLENVDLTDKQQGSEDGWLSWAWSYVPAVLSDDDEEDIIPEPISKDIEVKVNVGFYFDDFNIFFKVRAQS